MLYVDVDLYFLLWKLSTIIGILSIILCTAIAITPDGTKVISGSEDNSVQVWDFEKGTLLSEVSHGSHIRSIAVSNSYVIAGDLLGGIKVWALEE
ncbi:MAG: hypothetical protein HWN66_11315 [Candidatus Helarchaeota archaeon]|nr:hypothetical protein [Candidatus Helarchaeota archaeon]